MYTHKFDKAVIGGVNEIELVQHAQSGSQEALNTLIEEYYQIIFAYFYKNTNHSHQSKDLTQDVFIKMVANLSKYKPRAPFKSWLFTIASNHLKNYYRTLSRHPESVELSEEALVTESLTEQVEVGRDLQTALAHLPAKQKEVVILRYYYDFSIKDIAKITGALEITVKARIRYALEKLKHELEG